MFSDVLLTVDFDRTLTAPDSTIPARNIEAIRYFIENGGAFTVNTGRSVPMFRPLLGTIPVNAPLLLYNGSAAYDVAQGKLTQLRLIEMDMMQTLRTVMERFPDMNVELQGVDAHYIFQQRGDWFGFCASQNCACAAAGPDVNYGPFLKFSLYGEIRRPAVADLFDTVPGELRKMDEAQRWLADTFGDKVEVFRAAPRIIDVHARGVSKSAAAHALKESLRRKILVCVGDEQNDVLMLEGADFAYCPADSVLAGRFETVCKCGDGAVADVIYEKIPQIVKNGLDNGA